ncbi:MAG: hypothetical protein DI543_23230 [Bradyrhizobium icense]|nr:MAG: hypothetical protein DI543_23230 [Bradyrhizobium icense]
MIAVTVINYSKKKSFRSSKRIVTRVLPSVTNRVNIGCLPKRVLLKLIRNLRNNVTKGTSVKVFFEAKGVGYRGYKCIEIGRKTEHLAPFAFSISRIDDDLKRENLI